MPPFEHGTSRRCVKKVRVLACTKEISSGGFSCWSLRLATNGFLCDINQARTSRFPSCLESEVMQIWLGIKMVASRNQREEKPSIPPEVHSHCEAGPRKPCSDYGTKYLTTFIFCAS